MQKVQCLYFSITKIFEPLYLVHKIWLSSVRFKYKPGYKPRDLL